MESENKFSFSMDKTKITAYLFEISSPTTWILRVTAQGKIEVNSSADMDESALLFLNAGFKRYNVIFTTF